MYTPDALSWNRFAIIHYWHLLSLTSLLWQLRSQLRFQGMRYARRRHAGLDDGDIQRPSEQAGDWHINRVDGERLQAG